MFILLFFLDPQSTNKATKRLPEAPAQGIKKLKYYDKDEMWNWECWNRVCVVK